MAAAEEGFKVDQKMFDFLIIAGKDKKPLADNILAQFIDRKTDGVTFKYTKANYFVSEKRDRFALFCTNGDMKRHIAQQKESIRFFDGMIFQDDCVRDISNLAPILGKDEQDHSEVFGRYIYGEFAEFGESHIHRDVLGCEPLFMGFGADLTAVSNNPALCAQAVHGVDYKSKKDIKALAQVVLTKSIKDLTTSFFDVFFVPQNAGIKIDTNNNVSFYSLVERMYYPMSQEEWDARLEKVRKNCINLLSKVNIQKGDLTGGFDSRVSLALAIEAGIHKDILFSVIGYEDHPDVIIAKQIAEFYGLQLDHKSIEIPDSQKAEEILEQSYMDALRRQYRQSGMREFAEDWANTNNAILRFVNFSKPLIRNSGFKMDLTGSANEFFRGYFSLHLFLDKKIKNKVMAEEDRLFLIDNIIEKGQLTEKYYSFLFDKLYKHIQSYEDLYSYDLTLMQARAPQFHAGLSYRVLFSVGMNPWLHRLSMIQAPELRAAGQIPFKLIEDSAPDLLYFPFADKTWHYYVYAGNKNEKILKEIKPCVNKNKRPLPANTNTLRQITFLSNNTKLIDAIYEVYNEEYVFDLINSSKQEKPDQWKLNKLISIYGNSLFMDNQELPVLQDNTSSRLDSLILQSGSSSPIYCPPCGAYIVDAKTICSKGILLLSSASVFRAIDHNHLSIEQKAKFGINNDATQQNKNDGQPEAMYKKGGNMRIRSFFGKIRRKIIRIFLGRDLFNSLVNFKQLYENDKKIIEGLAKTSENINKINKRLDNVNEYAGKINKRVDNVNEYAGKINKRVDNVDKRLDNVNEYAGKINKRVDNVNEYADKINKRLDNTNEYAGKINSRVDNVNEKINKADERISRYNKNSWYRTQKYSVEEKYQDILSDWYFEITKKRLNLDNPRTYNEKIQWLKLYDSTPLKTRLADKYLVRDWVKEKIGEEYLVPLLGVYEKSEDIDFDTLPDRFVLKANHGSAWNIIVKEKNELNISQTKNKIDEFLNTNFAYSAGLELQYREIKPLIIAEQYIEDEEGQLNDYKIECFSDEPKYISIILDRSTSPKRNFYDLNWNLLPFTLVFPNSSNSINPPAKLHEMIFLAKKLCEGFCHVRVDFYCVESKIYFGEMTFTPASGIGKFEPPEWDNIWGDLIKLPIK